MPDWIPDWGDILDLNLMSVLWTFPFFIGTICTAIHTVWTWQRWDATRRLKERHSVQAAAFWFFRQDVINSILGVAMTAGGVCAILRIPMWPAWCVLTGAVAFAVNKIWNLFDDARVQVFLQSGRQRSQRS